MAGAPAGLPFFIPTDTNKVACTATETNSHTGHTRLRIDMAALANANSWLRAPPAAASPLLQYLSPIKQPPRAVGIERIANQKRCACGIGTENTNAIANVNEL